MSILRKIELKWIQLSMTSFLKSQEISFKQSAAEAKRVLILFPAFFSTDEASRQVRELVATFGKREICVLYLPGPLPDVKSLNSLQLKDSNLNQISRRRLDSMGSLQTLLRNPFDIFLDLSSSESLLGPYLCNKCRFTLRICRSNHPHKVFYNIQFNGLEQTGLLNMVQQLLKSK